MSRKNNHSKYHNPNAFCGYAGSYEMAHLVELVERLTDNELKLLVRRVGIHFDVDGTELERENYEQVIDEADREDFYREYKKIISARKQNESRSPRRS